LAFSTYEADTKEIIEMMTRRFYIELSALWILIYAFEFTTSYCYRKLWKKQVNDGIYELRLGSININLYVFSKNETNMPLN